MTEELKKEFSKLRFVDENGELYPEWEEKKLGEVSEIRGNGVSFPQEEMWDYPVTRIETISGRIVNYNKVGYVEKEPNSIHKLKQGDILLSNINSIDHIGKTAYVNSNRCLFHGMNLIRLTNYKNTSGAYLYVVLNSFGARKFFKSNAKRAVSQASINQKEISRYFFPLPSLPEQTKIANFLSKIDEKIEAQAKLVELLKKQKQGYSQKIFNGSLRFKKDDGTDYDDWEEKKLGETIASGGSGGTPTSTNKKYYNGQYPFLAVSDITKQGKYLKSTEKSLTDLGVKNSGAWVVPANSLIYTLYASVGKMCINKQPITTSQALYAMKFNDTELLEYMYYAITEFNKKKINKFITIGTQANINANSLKSFEIPIPSLSEQEKIAAFLANLDNRIEKETNKLEKLKLAKQAYMQRVLV